MSDLRSLRPVLPILIGASVMLSLAMGLRQSLGLFMPPLTRDTGISVSRLHAGHRGAEPGLGLPAAAGRRLGGAPGLPRRLMVGGALLYIAGPGAAGHRAGPARRDARRGRGHRRGAGLHRHGAGAWRRRRAPVPAALRSTVLGIVSAAGSLGAMLAAPIGQALSRRAWAGASACWGFVVLALLMLPAAWVAGRVDALPLPPPAGRRRQRARARWAWRCATRRSW